MNKKLEYHLTISLSYMQSLIQAVEYIHKHIQDIEHLSYLDSNVIQFQLTELFFEKEFALKQEDALATADIEDEMELDLFLQKHAANYEELLTATVAEYITDLLPVEEVAEMINAKLKQQA